MVPYIQGTGEKFKKVCRSKGIQEHFKYTNTPRTLLVTPKDKDPKLHKCRVIYHFNCPHINCPATTYIGESGRALGESIKECLKAPSPIHQHSSSTGHPLSPECFNSTHWETQGSSRNTKEAIFICVNGPSLNRNIGKYQLPHVWDNILQDTSVLQVKPSSLTPSPSPLLGPSPPQVPQPPPNSSLPTKFVHMYIS